MLKDYADTVNISIHALLAESDRRGSTRTAKLCDFYPRSPCGERHLQLQFHFSHRQISIHALLAESDNQRLADASHSPKFLSTLSLRRATSSLHSFVTSF